MKPYRVVHRGGDNYILERTDELGRAISARPASAEEWDMAQQLAEMARQRDQALTAVTHLNDRVEELKRERDGAVRSVFEKIKKAFEDEKHPRINLKWVLAFLDGLAKQG